MKDHWDTIMQKQQLCRKSNLLLTISKHNDISNLLISIELVGDILNLWKSLNCRFVKQKRHTVLFKYLVSNQKDVKWMQKLLGSNRIAN